MKSFVEGALRFDFGDGWAVEKYDDHADYRQGIQRLRDRARVEVGGRVHVVEVGTKAVDFIGLRAGSVHFIEVKDFRGYRIENKPRIHDGDLAVEVAVKVRDTIAGIIGARQRPGGERWLPFIDALTRRGRPHVCLWLEEDTLHNRRMERGHPGIALQRDLQGRLSWMAPRVLLRSRAGDTGISGIVVQSLADGVVELRAHMRAAGRITWDQYRRAFRASPLPAGEALKELCARAILCEVRDEPLSYSAGAAWLEWDGR